MKGGSFKESKSLFLWRKSEGGIVKRRKKMINPVYLPTIPSFRSSSGSCRIKKRKVKYVYIYLFT